MANYDINNFIISPTTEDKTIKIFDKYGVLKYTFNPSLSYYFYKNNYVFIKVENSDDITLDFETNAQAISALEKLNSAKKTIVAQATADITYYTKTELDAGQLDNRYYTSAQTSDLISNGYSPTGHSHYVTGLTDVNVTSLSNGEVLVYNGSEWVNSSFTFNTSAFTSNYYTIEDLSSSTGNVYINYNNLINTPTSATDLGLDDVYTKDQVYTKSELTGGTLDDRYYTKTLSDGRYFNKTESEANFLSANTEIYTQTEAESSFLSANTEIYTQSEIDNNFLSASTTASDIGGIDSTYVENNFLSASTTASDLDVYTKSESDSNFLSASTSISELSNSSHTHLWVDIVNTSHTHDERYYTKTELYTDGELDDRYYTKTVSDSRYYIQAQLYTSAETLALFIPYYTSAQTDALLATKSNTSHTHTYSLSALTDINFNNLSSGDYFVYDGNEWVNSAVSFNINDYYTKTQLDNGQLNTLYIPLAGSTGITGDLTPATDGGASLGSPTRQWKELYVSGGTIYIDNVEVGVEDGVLIVDGQPLATTAQTANNYSPTGHTHDDLYYRISQFSGGTVLGSGVLDDRYYVKTVADIQFYGRDYLYTSAQTDALLEQYYTSAQTDTLLEDYYTKTESDANFLSANTDLYTQSEAENSFLSANTSYYTQEQVDTGFLSANTSIYTRNEAESSFLSASTEIYTQSEAESSFLSASTEIYTQSEAESSFLSANTFDSTIDTNGINNTGGITATTFYGNLNWNYITNSSHSHLWSDIVNTSHTHDDRYYTETELDAGALDNLYYEKTVADGTFYKKTELYTSAQIDTILEDYYTETESNTNFLSANTSYYTQSQVNSGFLSANTSYYTQSQADSNFISASTSVYSRDEAESSFLSANTSYYTQLEVDNLLNNYALGNDLTAHTSATGTSNPHGISFFDLTNTSHTHDDRYWTKTDLSGGTPYGDGVLDERYYTKIAANSLFSTYEYVDDLFSAITFSGATGVYYTRTQVDNLLLGKSDTGHTHALSGLSDVDLTGLADDNILVYSAATNTWYNTTLANLSIDLSAYYTSAETYALLSSKTDFVDFASHTANTSNPHETSFTGLTSTAHTHSWSDLTNTSHTHSEYSVTSHTHNSLYYTQTIIDATFVPISTLAGYYTSAETLALFDPYYTSAQTDILLDTKSNTGHSHYVTGLTDVSVSSLSFGEVLVYSGGSWVNSSVTADLSNYYTSSQVDNLLSAITLDSGATRLIDLTDTTITTPSSGEGLVYNGSSWVNSSITVDLSLYFTSAETISNFLSANTTMFSNSAHSHYISGLTDVISGWTVTDGQFLQYSASLSGWTPVTAAGLTGSFLSLSGGTLTGDLVFSFMTGTTAQTNRVLEVTTGGTVVEGDEVVDLYITDTSLIDFITTGDTISATTYWSGNTFVNPGISAFTLYEGQRYIDNDYFYEYYDGVLYRTHYANYTHTHNDLYYTKQQLNPTGSTVAVLDDRYLSITSLSSLTLISLSDVYDMTPGSYDDNFLRYDSFSGWTGYNLDVDNLVFMNDIIPTGRTVTGVSGLTGGGTLDSNVQIAHLTADTTTNVDVANVPTALVQNVEFDEYGHVTKYETANYNGYWIREIADAQDVDLTLLGAATDPYLYFDAAENKWLPTGLTIDRISGLQTQLDAYVKRLGETVQTIQGKININGELYVQDDLYVAGTTTTIDSELVITDDIILLNSGSTPAINQLSGLRIDRGNQYDFHIVHDEGSLVNASGGTLKVGPLGNLKTVLTAPSDPVNGGVAFWLNPPVGAGYFETLETLKWNSGQTRLELNYGANLKGGFDETGYTYSGVTTLRDVIRSIDISQYKEDNSGFDMWNSSGTYYSIESNSSFTLLSGGYGFIRGRRLDFNSGQTIQLTANKTNYIYIDSTGTIQKTTNDSVGDIYKDGIVLFEALYDGSETVVVKENHPYSMDTDVSTYLHRNVGVIIRGTGAIIGIVSTDTGSTQSQEVKITGEDYLEDHGVQTTIPDSSSSGVSWNVYYTNAGGQWIKYSGDTSLPNKFNSGGTPTTITSGNYVIYTLYVSKDDINSTLPKYFAVMDGDEYGSSSSAVTAISDGLTRIATNELAALEFAQLGYAVVHNNGSTHYVDSVIVEKSSFNTKLIGGNVVNHLILDGLTDGQYGDGGHTNLVTKSEKIVDPTVNDDIDSYKIGSLWVNTVTDKVFVNVDNTNGAAIWKEVNESPDVADQQVLYMTGTTITGSSNLTFDDSTLNVGVNIIPDGDGTRSLGSTTNQWKDLWVSGGTIYLDRIPLTTDGIDLVWSGSTITGTKENKTLIVDSYYGDDTTGVRGEKPYATVLGAENDAISGDTIVINPGEYYDLNMGKDGISYFWKTGSKHYNILDQTGHTYTDINKGNITFNVYGYGVFYMKRTYGATDWDYSVLRVGSGSTIVFEADEIDDLGYDSGDGDGANIYVQSGTVGSDVTVKVRKHTSAWLSNYVRGSGNTFNVYNDYAKSLGMILYVRETGLNTVNVYINEVSLTLKHPLDNLSIRFGNVNGFLKCIGDFDVYVQVGKLTFDRDSGFNDGLINVNETGNGSIISKIEELHLNKAPIFHTNSTSGNIKFVLDSSVVYGYDDDVSLFTAAGSIGSNPNVIISNSDVYIYGTNSYSGFVNTDYIAEQEILNTRVHLLSGSTTSDVVYGTGSVLVNDLSTNSVINSTVTLVSGYTHYGFNSNFAGNVSATTYYGDGSNLTGIVDSTLASNGLTKTGETIKLGGETTEDTTIETGEYSFGVGTSSGGSLAFVYPPIPSIEPITILGTHNLTGDSATALWITPSEMEVKSQFTDFSGLTYENDYSANFVDRTLVDKGYVDNAISGGAAGNHTEIQINSGGSFATSSSLTYDFDTNILTTTKLELTEDGEGVIMSSPNGTRYKITVDNSGNLVSTAV